MLFNYVEPKQVFKWIAPNKDWPIIKDIFSEGSPWVVLTQMYPEEEFMIIEKYRFNNSRFAIRVILLGREIIGWLICGDAQYPMQRML